MRWLKADADTASQRLMSEQSAFIFTDALTKISRPDLPKNMESSKNLPKIAWKTGTSWRKDAWSIGYNANYTIGVWVGNFGEGVPNLEERLLQHRFCLTFLTVLITHRAMIGLLRPTK